MIRKMELIDIPRVAEINVFGWRVAYRGIVSDELLFTKRLVATSIPRFQGGFFGSENNSEGYVFDDGIIKGFISVQPCADKDKPQAFELGAIYIEPLMKRKGIGTALMHFCEKLALERGHSEICLWVLEKNQDSRRFYEKMGYDVDGAHKYLEGLEATEVRYSKQLKKSAVNP